MIYKIKSIFLQLNLRKKNNVIGGKLVYVHGFIDRFGSPRKSLKFKGFLALY